MSYLMPVPSSICLACYNRSMNKKSITELEKIFKVLGNRQRLTILALLQERSYTVSEIVAQLDMEQSAVSHQLKVLREAQLVTTQRQGRLVLYCLSDSHILILLDNALKHVDHVFHNDQEKSEIKFKKKG